MKQKKGENKCCYKLCRELEVSCPNKNCKYWINYENELNCIFQSIYINGEMTLKQVGERIGVSITEVGKIENNIFSRARKLFCREKEFTILKDYLS
jgi:hypothetical protein